MTSLIDDITEFLRGNGIECARTVCCGAEAICAEIPGRSKRKVILPLEIRAKSPEEARESAASAHGAVTAIKEAEGYPLIITEDRWISQREMMKARLLAHLEIFESVFARNCEVRRIEKTDARTFLASSHSYAYASCRYHFGLFRKSDGLLIAVATFSNARKWIKDGKEIRSYEWTRYASLPGMRISGGMGKLLKAFINEIRPDDIMSYADLEWSEGEVYRTLGFSREPAGKAPVTFTINPATHERKALGNQLPEDPSKFLYFTNLGSAKYRLKLTEY